MFKMVTIQTVLKVKTLSLFSIKKHFNFELKYFSIFLSFLLFSCSSNLINAQELKPDAVECGISRTISNNNDPETITIKNKKFKKKLEEIGFENTDEDYNLFVSLGLRGNKGYSLIFDKLTNNKNNLKIYFKEIKPQKNIVGAAVPTYPFCLLKINNLSKFEVIID